MLIWASLVGLTLLCVD